MSNFKTVKKKHARVRKISFHVYSHSECSDKSTKNRNRKSPRFLVAYVPAASQAAAGTFFFPRKNSKINRNRLRFAIARRNRKAPLGGQFWGPKNRYDFFTRNRRRIATLGALSFPPSSRTPAGSFSRCSGRGGLGWRGGGRAHGWRGSAPQAALGTRPTSGGVRLFWKRSLALRVFGICRQLLDK